MCDKVTHMELLNSVGSETENVVVEENSVNEVSAFIDDIVSISCESESGSESESESGSESKNDFCDNLLEEDLDEITIMINEYIDDYLKTEVLKMSHPDFHKHMIEDITHILFQSFQDAEVLQDSDYDSLLLLVDHHCEDWFYSGKDLNYPARTITHYNANAHVHEYGLAEDYTKNYLTDKLSLLRELNDASPKQRTPEWYQGRYNMITASNIWQAFNSQAQVNRLIYEKCKPLDFGYTENKWVNTENSLHWGVKYEPLTVLVYERLMGAKVEEFGCIQHPKYPFIGASPDGIITNRESPLYGRMLEIKNIYNREMDGIPSEAYWIQTQIQMEACDLDVCDFVETRFEEYDDASLFYQDTESDSKMRGIILHFAPKDGASNVPLYKYMPLNILADDSGTVDKSCTVDKSGTADKSGTVDKSGPRIDEWICQTINDVSESHVLFKTIYWYLADIKMSIVKRNAAWFKAALPIIEQTWNTILEERVSGYEHRAAKKRGGSSTNNILVINSENGSDSQLITNMPIMKSGGICLIKIE